MTDTLAYPPRGLSRDEAAASKAASETLHIECLGIAAIIHGNEPDNGGRTDRIMQTGGLLLEWIDYLKKAGKI